MLYANIALAQQKASVQKAKQWLQASLVHYFDDSLTMKQLATDRYARFKTDAMSIGFDGGMSQKAFEEEWAPVYDVKQPEVGKGFLIPLQDWNSIMIANCRFIHADKQVLWFTLDVVEYPSSAFFSRYVKLVSINGMYRIDDVLETMTVENGITGDFNGDHKADTLAVSFISLIDNRPIAIDTALSYDSLITSVISKKPVLQLVAPGWKTLNLNQGNFYVLGLSMLKNIGNISKLPGDEIAVIIEGADWSNSNVCHIYSYGKYGWKKIKSIEIREEDISKIESGKIKPWKN